MPLTIQRTEQGDLLVFHPAGDVDLSSSPDLRKLLLATAKEPHPTIAVNLSVVEYMDSSGVAVLVEGLKACRDCGKAFVLIAPSPPVMKVLQLMKLNAVFEIREES